MNSNIYTKAYILIGLILLQSTASILSMNKTAAGAIGINLFIYEYPYLLELLINALGISTVFWLLYIVRTLKQEENFCKSLDHSGEIIEALRSQKHDFNNHMNVVSGMLQLNKTDSALSYIYDICGRSNEVLSISKIENTEIAAIVYSKCAIAQSKGITVELDIESSLEKLSVSTIDLSKIMFNLIDNAVHALEQCAGESEKILSIDIREAEERYIISITNSHPVIRPEIKEKVFCKGFSTKEDSSGEHGYGLFIVKNTVEKNSGSIEVESYEGVGTIFTVFLPHKKSH